MDRPYEADIRSGYIKNGYGIYGAWIRKKKQKFNSTYFAYSEK